MPSTFNTIQYAFVAGEISPTYLGRQDLQKYDLGLELAKNWFIDYRGGLSTRPGTKFHDFVWKDNLETKFFRFRYAPDTANTYLLLFGDQYIRFLQEGGYVLEDAKVITSVTSASPGVVTSAAHGYATGDWVKIAGRTFEVGVTATNTFQLLDPFGDNFSTVGITAILTATSVARLYTIETPYVSADLSRVRIHQHLNDVYITHKNYAPRKLTRNDATDWDFAEVEIENTVESPASLAITSTSDDGRSVIAAVTAVNAVGGESLPTYQVESNMAEFNTVSDSLQFIWPSVPGALKYNIYRSETIVESVFSSGQQIGFIGQSSGLSFTDTNILPDFTVTPPQGYNPFANGAVDTIEITAGGSGYDENVDVTLTDASPDAGGFVGIATVKGGVIETVLIINRGHDYTAPTLVFSSGGTGATGTVTLTPATGNNPALFTVFQQRGVYAATENQPITVWGSHPGDFEDFSFSNIVVEDDSYEFTLDAEEVSPIRHLMASRGGLLVMSQSGIWLVTGGNETAVSPINALSDPQTFNGVSDVPPISIGPDILYIEGKGGSVKLLSYNDFSKVYGGISMSILANHLFTPEKQITSWAYAESPYNVVWGVRSDGAILAFTFMKEQSVYAWTQCWTQGLFKDTIAIQEGVSDVEYLMVQRYVDGRWTKMIESFAPRDIDHVEDAWAVDSGVALSATYPNTTLSMDGLSDYVVITAGSAIFSSGDVGKVVRVGGGKGTVTVFGSTTRLGVNFSRPITNVIPETSIPMPVAAGEWTLDTPVSSVSGLWHLEGQTVAVLADGNVMTDRVVENGAITLDYPVTRLVVGLSYRCVARNLPLTSQDAIIEDKRKRIVGVGIRLYDTRGLKYGRDLTRLYPMKERTNEPYGEPTRLLRDMRYGLVDGDFDVNSQLYFVQDYPLPATVLGFVQDFELGDEND
jgi:hypothetical protein